ncbi:MAG: type II toxin-antitoxin system VapC family toxin [Pseudomonadota bacterium]
MYLIDTNVISELRRPRPHGGVLAWISAVADDEIFLSAVTLGELQAGIEKFRTREPAKARAIEAWVDQVAASYNVLAMDGRTFRRWAIIQHGRPDVLIEDAMIAATAIMHKLTVVTRNVRDFKRFGVGVLDPFTGRKAT